MKIFFFQARLSLNEQYIWVKNITYFIFHPDSKIKVSRISYYEFFGIF